MGKERQLYRVFGPVFLAGLAIVACQDQKTAPTGSPAVRTATIAPETKVLIDQQSWELLPAVEKIKTLEARGLDPAKYEIKAFNPRQELVGAVAAFYCEQTKCLKDPQEMAANVSFLDTEQFLAAIEKEKQKTLSSDERAKLTDIFEETMKESRQVLVNVTAISNYVQKLVRGEILLAAGPPRGDLGTEAYEAMLFHAFTHANIVPQIVEFEPISIRIQGGPNQINLEVVFEKMDRFNLVGHLANSNLEYSLGGFNEALTELTAIIIATRAGDHLSAHERYAGGAGLIRQINIRAGVNNEEFIKYNNGQLPLEELLAKWGALKNRQNPDIQAAALAATAIALYVEGLGDLAGTRSSITNFLGITLR